MAKIAGIPRIELEVTITLTEAEARALHALFGYSVEAFLSTFYEKMGKSYLQPYEGGLKSLHNSHGFLADALRGIDDARKVFNPLWEKPQLAKEVL